MPEAQTDKLGVNLYSVKAAGRTEDIIVIIKVIILSLFAVAGLFYVKADYLLPVFDQGGLGVLMGAALIFVAYEGFELIPNAVNEMKNPQRDLPRSVCAGRSVSRRWFLWPG